MVLSRTTDNGRDRKIFETICSFYKFVTTRVERCWWDISIYGRSVPYSSKHILPQQLAPPVPSHFVGPATLVQNQSIRRRLPPVFFLPPTYSSPLIHSYHYTRSRSDSPLILFCPSHPQHLYCLQHTQLPLHPPAAVHCVTKSPLATCL